jgi:hypothetical protein
MKVILIIIVIVVALFLKDMGKMKRKVQKEGGMKVKYSLLINHLLNEAPNMKITKVTATDVDLVSGGAVGSFAYFLTHTHSGLVVQWKFQNAIYGNHKLTMEFPNGTSQQNMITEISSRVETYCENLGNQ